MVTQPREPSMYNTPAATRRIIYVEVSSDNKELISPFDDFDINITRTPFSLAFA